MSKPVLMIHEFREEFLDLPLEDYILTFDDGLRSPLEYWNVLRDLDTIAVFFVAPHLLSTGFEGKHSDEFMSTWELNDLLDDGVIIGGHSHYHHHLADIKKISDKAKLIHSDTTKMLAWFDCHLNHRPSSFCFPFNEHCSIYQGMLRQMYGFKYFYGSERIDIEDLIKEKQNVG